MTRQLIALSTTMTSLNTTLLGTATSLTKQQGQQNAQLQGQQKHLISISSTYRQIANTLATLVIIEDTKMLLHLLGEAGKEYALANITLEARQDLFEAGLAAARKTGLSLGDIAKVQGTLLEMGQDALAADVEQVSLIARMHSGLKVDVQQAADLARITKINNVEFKQLADTMATIVVRTGITGKELAGWTSKLEEMGSFYGADSDLQKSISMIAAVQGGIKNVTGDTHSLIDAIADVAKDFSAAARMGLDLSADVASEANIKRITEMADNAAASLKGLTPDSPYFNMMLKIQAQAFGISEKLLLEAAKLQAKNKTLTGEALKELAKANDKTSLVAVFRKNLEDAGDSLSNLEHKFKTAGQWLLLPAFGWVNDALKGINTELGVLATWLRELKKDWPESFDAARKGVGGLAILISGLLTLGAFRKGGGWLLSLIGIGGKTSQLASAGTSISTTSRLLSRSAVNFVVISVGLAAFAGALWVLGKAAQEFAKIDPERMNHTLIAMAASAGGLIAVGAVLSLMGGIVGRFAPQVALGVGIIAVGLAALAGDLYLFSKAAELIPGQFDAITKSVGYLIDRLSAYQTTKAALKTAELNYVTELSRLQKSLDDRGAAGDSVTKLASGLDAMADSLGKLGGGVFTWTSPLDHLERFFGIIKNVANLDTFVSKMGLIADAFERISATIHQLNFSDIFSAGQLRAVTTFLNGVSLAAAPAVATSGVISRQPLLSLQPVTDGLDGIQDYLKDIKDVIVRVAPLLEKRLTGVEGKAMQFPGGANGPLSAPPPSTAPYVRTP